MSSPIECAGGCGNILVGKQKKWCSTACSKRKGREQWLRKVYDISLEEYDLLLDYQHGVCGICGRPPKPGKSLAVDHAHVAGRSGPVRGLLCFFCNRRIIGARSADVVIKAADYLRNPPAVAAFGGERIAPGRPVKKRAPVRRRRI